MSNSIKSYYEIAENDFLWMQETMNNHKEGGTIFNSACAHAQNTVEKYLKHIITMLPCSEEDEAERTAILKTHSVKRLTSFLHKSKVKLNFESFDFIDGYYFETRYPGDECFFVEEYDLQKCWRALKNCRDEVNSWLLEVQNSVVQKAEKFVGDYEATHSRVADETNSLGSSSIEIAKQLGFNFKECEQNAIREMCQS